jgi:hypothetical protein
MHLRWRRHASGLPLPIGYIADFINVVRNICHLLPERNGGAFLLGRKAGVLRRPFTTCWFVPSSCSSPTRCARGNINMISHGPHCRLYTAISCVERRCFFQRLETQQNSRDWKPLTNNWILTVSTATKDLCYHFGGLWQKKKPNSMNYFQINCLHWLIIISSSSIKSLKTRI